MEELKSVGLRIRDIRKRCKISQERLAELTGLNHRTVLRIENGHTLPTLETLAKIAKILECNIADFFTAGHSKSRDEILSDIFKKIHNFTDEELKKFYINFCML